MRPPLVSRLFILFGLASAKKNIPIHVINLKRDTTRWNNISSQLETNKLKEQTRRLEAVYRKDLSKEELRSNASLAARLFCTAGTIGCYLSHRRFWQIVDDDDETPYQIVFEDDALLEDDFYQRAEAAITELEQHPDTKDRWDVLLLGGLGCVNPSKRYGPYHLPAFLAGGCRSPKLVTEHCHIPKRPFGTHAYVLSKRGARKLLEMAWKAVYHVDCVAWGIRELDLYVCDPLLVFQDSAPSTVGAITSGIETWIPSQMKMDDYTKMSVEWVWNEPVIRIPVLNVVITQGRYVILGIIGSVLSLLQLQKRPWMLPTHLFVYVLFMWSFNRYMCQPRGR